MRALKSVLMLAGALKREEYALINELSSKGTVGSENVAIISEDNIVMRALSDANVPKLVGEDVLLFYGLVMDLFPFDMSQLQQQLASRAAVKQPSIGGFRPDSDTPLPHADSSSTMSLNALTEQQAHLPSWMRTIDSARARRLVAALDHTLKQSGLQQPPAFVRKIMQLDATVQVRFGTAIVGGPGTGKSTMVATLAHALSCLGARGAIPAYTERAKSSRTSRRMGARDGAAEAAAALGKQTLHAIRVCMLSNASTRSPLRPCCFLRMCSC